MDCTLLDSPVLDPPSPSPLPPNILPSSYGAHFAGLSADTVYTVTVNDPSGAIITTWSTASSDAAVHYLVVRRRKFRLPTFPLALSCSFLL